MKKSNRLGKINSSQDGVVVYEWSVAPCLSAGHGNCPKVILCDYEEDAAILEWDEPEDSTSHEEGIHRVPGGRLF